MMAILTILTPHPLHEAFALEAEATSRYWRHDYQTAAEIYRRAAVAFRAQDTLAIAEGCEERAAECDAICAQLAAA
jgi:hypothetical protein